MYPAKLWSAVFEQEDRVPEFVQWDNHLPIVFWPLYRRSIDRVQRWIETMPEQYPCRHSAAFLLLPTHSMGAYHKTHSNVKGNSCGPTIPHRAAGKESASVRQVTQLSAVLAPFWDAEVVIFPSPRTVTQSPSGLWWAPLCFRATMLVI
jgi:hypothetical protein